MGHQAHSLRRHSARGCTRTGSTRIRGGTRIAARRARVGRPDRTWIRLDGSARIYRAHGTWIRHTTGICRNRFSSPEKLVGCLKDRTQKGNSEDPRDDGKQNPAPSAAKMSILGTPMNGQPYISKVMAPVPKTPAKSTLLSFGDLITTILLLLNLISRKVFDKLSSMLRLRGSRLAVRLERAPAGFG